MARISPHKHYPGCEHHEAEWARKIGVIQAKNDELRKKMEFFEGESGYQAQITTAKSALNAAGRFIKERVPDHPPEVMLLIREGLKIGPLRKHPPRRA